MKWQRSELDGIYQLEIFDCPIHLLAGLAEMVCVDVTVENFTPVRYWNEWFESNQSIHPGSPASRRMMRNAVFDLALKSEDFLSLLPFWDDNGVYAVFTERSPIPFRASDLKVPSRYRALKNFGFVLEFALAGPSSAGVSVIASPRSDLVDHAVKLLGKS